MVNSEGQRHSVHIDGTDKVMTSDVQAEPSEGVSAAPAAETLAYPSYVKLTPLLAQKRAEGADGLWAPKQYGDFEPGLPRNTDHFVQGSIEKAVVENVEPSGDSSDEESEDAAKPKKVPGAPTLYCFLTKKKPKMRMADLEETSFLLRLDLGVNGSICEGKALGTFGQSMLNVPDPTDYAGVVIAKRKSDEPRTNEPIIYGFARLLRQQRPVIPSEIVLGLTLEKDRVQRQNKIARRKAKTDEQLIKSMKMYTRVARRAWELLSKDPQNKINYEELQEALHLVDIPVKESRAQRIWNACHTDGSGAIDMTDFEIGLMAHDAIDDKGYLTPHDSFIVFDLDSGGTISLDEFLKAVDVLTGQKWSEDKAAALFKKMDKKKIGAINFDSYREAWLKFVDVKYELSRRGLMVCEGALSSSRNMKALRKAVKEEEQAADDAWKVVRVKVENLRFKARQRRDESRKKRAELAGHVGIMDAKEAADRRKHQRMAIQKAQKERSQQRQEQKVLQNQLQLAQAEQRRTEELAQRFKKAENESERMAAVRAAGYDQIWLNGTQLRELPEEMLTDDIWLDRLPNTVLCDLSGNRLRELPVRGFFSLMLPLRKLSLSQNRLERLHETDLKLLSKLQILVLDRNELLEIPDVFESLPNLERLDVSCNNLRALPNSIGHLSMLKCLITHSNALVGIPHTCCGMTHLEIADFSVNMIETLPNELSEMACLTALNISRNKIDNLPLDVGNLCNLEILDASCNMLSTLPASMLSLNKLAVLRLQQNCIQAMGDVPRGMRALLELDVSTNEINNLGSGIGDCRHLQKLSLRRNRLGSIPLDIGLCSKLLELDIAENRIQALPDEIGALVSLRVLDVSANNLKNSLTEHMGLMRNLVRLDLGRNSIPRLPPTLGALSLLEILNLHRNKLEMLPENIKYLESLKSLDLSCNHISRVPPALYHLSQLEDLDLASNVIRELDSDIGKLSMLKKLSLRHNLIKHLPLEIVDLADSIPEFDIESNPVDGLPEKWCASGKKSEQLKQPLGGWSQWEIIAWLRAEKALHESASDEWAARGALYLTNRASMQEFQHAVQVALERNGAWRPHLTPHIYRFYLYCKESGVPPPRGKETADQAAFRLEVKGQLQRRRKKLAADCHERAAQNRAQEQRVYGCDGMPAELVAARSALRSMQAPSNILVTAKYD